MKITLFNSKSYDVESFNKANAATDHEIVFIDAPLGSDTAPLAKDSVAICVFVNDTVDRALLEQLYAQGVRLITLRCAGYNNVDINTAQELGIQVANVPAYSPYAVAEHALALMLALNRHIPEADKQVHNGNFSLAGLKGFDLHGKTAGIIGTGRIGAILACTLQSIGMRVLAVDPIENPECCSRNIQYVSLDTLLAEADVISLHCPLTESSCQLITKTEINQMKKGVMLINTSRGAILNTHDVLEGLRSKQIGYLGIDVYEREQGLFFEDRSESGYEDTELAELLSMPNVLVTPHQAFFTNEALANIAEATLNSLSEFEQGKPLSHGLK